MDERTLCLPATPITAVGEAVACRKGPFLHGSLFSQDDWGAGVTDGLTTQRKEHLCVKMIPRHQVECPQLLEIPVIGQKNLVAGVGGHGADNLQVL